MTHEIVEIGAGYRFTLQGEGVNSRVALTYLGAKLIDLDGMTCDRARHFAESMRAAAHSKSVAQSAEDAAREFIGGYGEENVQKLAIAFQAYAAKEVATALEGQGKKLGEVVYAVALNVLTTKRLQETNDEEGLGYRIVDALTPPEGTVDAGKREAERIADEIAGDFIAAHTKQETQS